MTLLLTVWLTGAQAFAARLGGAYFVDDADIGSLGSCEVETWASFAANHDRVVVFSPACVFNVGREVEVGTNHVYTRSGGVWTNTIAFTAKTVLIEIGRPSGIGLAMSGALTYDPSSGALNGFIANVPFSIEFNPRLRLNLNLGTQYDAVQQALFATLGVGVSWNVTGKWSLISEAFAVIGRGETNPRFQTGVRYQPTKDVDCDLIFGRNITGERSSWVTLGLTVRIGDTSPP